MSAPRIAVSGVLRNWDNLERTGVNAAYVRAVLGAGGVPVVLSPLLGPAYAARALDGADGLLDALKRFQGYLSHESCRFDEQSRTWVFLPRKAHTQRWSDEDDEGCARPRSLLSVLAAAFCVSLLLRCSSCF